ncbi:class I SAM-dependent methyltransferase [Cognatishimia sp. WU-CL00825]|uniref:class I SAM-dependent methyltransferase n=1 Tax=Cognatishimia sp. WU-CL00825 TaxID=3127658 RepID=UPI0031090CDE
MLNPRLSLAVDGGQIALPSEGRIAVFAPTQGADLSALPKDRCVIIQSFKPDHDAFAQAGYDCVTEANGELSSGEFSASVVFLTRAKVQARALIAQAASFGGLVIVDGQKTDGAESFLKECKKRSDIQGKISKAHGKLFWFQGGDYADWVSPGPKDIGEGFVTAPGVFSADGIDPASAALAAALPVKLGKNVADLGAGWGYLSQSILQRDGVETLYLIEAEKAALDCAKQNITDPRAEFHWADATLWAPRAKMDTVVMNPPFHTGRAAEPELGRKFIAAAAAMLAPAGHLWLVANRHLPYETTLEGLFAKVTEMAGDNRFKVLRAERPSRPRR